MWNETSLVQTKHCMGIHLLYQDHIKEGYALAASWGQAAKVQVGLESCLANRPMGILGWK